MADPLIVRSVAEIRERLDPIRREESRIGLVPTMGALHRGHVRLIESARSECDTVVVSIFVNPLQFGPDEDFLRYPRPLVQDTAVCTENGVDIIFAPETQEMHSGHLFTFVEV